VRNVDFRLVDGGAKQMVLDIPYLAPGEEARAIFTFEVTRSWLLPPEETGIFVIPKRMDRQTRRMLAPSPGIESRHPKIRNLGREILKEKKDASAWTQVRAMYDWVRQNVEYIKGPFKGGLAALKDKNGDCEELSSLFIALCRSQGIPARTVWIPGHCYPEFYLQDEGGQGYWFPCQAAGDEAFGEMPESRPVLQKGDNFRHPTQKRKRMRYMAEILQADDGVPQLHPVRELLGEVR
jgi:transglutaminase-like putative cysteine protease